MMIAHPGEPVQVLVGEIFPRMAGGNAAFHMPQALIGG